MRDKFGRDVFIHRKQIGDLRVGDELTFICETNKEGNPQARDPLHMDGRFPGDGDRGSGRDRDDDGKGKGKKGGKGDGKDKGKGGKGKDGKDKGKGKDGKGGKDKGKGKK